MVKSTAERAGEDRWERGLAKVYMALAHRLRWSGAENVPAGGPAILAPNHQSFLDPLAIGACLRRRVVYMGLDQYCRMAVVGPLMLHCGVIPVSPGESPHGPLVRMLHALGEGRLCGIFPEGGRTKDGCLMPPQEGVAVLALRSGAPLVPVTIAGAYEAWPIGRSFPRAVPISVWFGAPIRAGTRSTAKARRELALELMLSIADGFAHLGRPETAHLSRRRVLDHYGRRA